MMVRGVKMSGTRIRGNALFYITIYKNPQTKFNIESNIHFPEELSELRQLGNLRESNKNNQQRI